ncbi:MAG: hypothetical protein WBF97_06470, partial [Comamonas sp.]
MAALLVASNGADAGVVNYENPYGETVDQLSISTTAPYVSNAGSIANFYGENGIEVVGTTVEGSISNAGSISVSDVEEGDDILRGISVVGSSIWGNIDNSGTIDVMAQGTGYGQSSRYAAGIELGEESLFSGSVSNDGSIDVYARVANVDEYGSEEGDISLAAEAAAYGIRLDNSGLSSSGVISNSGDIDVEATSQVDQSASHSGESIDSWGDGYARAYAAGIDARNDGHVGDDHRGPGVAGGVYLYSYDAGIDVAATAQSFSAVLATADCEDSNEFCSDPCYADVSVVDDASAQAYGLTLGGNSAVVGAIYNDAMIEVSALAETQSDADVTSLSGSARAFAGYREVKEYEYDEYFDVSEVDAAATGLNVDLLQVQGDIINSEDIQALAIAIGQSTATADALGYVEAMAGNDVYAVARGIAVDTLLINGDFTNEASAIGLAEANSTNTSLALSEGEAESKAISDARAVAAGIDIRTDALGGTFTNENEGYWHHNHFYGEVVKGEASAHVVADASANGGEHSSADAIGYAQAEAH